MEDRRSKSFSGILHGPAAAVTVTSKFLLIIPRITTIADLRKQTGWNLRVVGCCIQARGADHRSRSIVLVESPGNSRISALTLSAVFAGLLPLAITGWWSQTRIPQRVFAAVVARAAFDENGSVHLPADFRQWAHVGTRYKVGGNNILDGTKVTTPEVLNAYVEPSALAYYKSTGKWPDGAQIVKELSNVQTGKNCDSATFLCTTPLGSGMFETNYIGVGMMVKDQERFSNAPGNWAYFAFFRKTSGYDPTAQNRPREQCESCHVKLASDTDYVIVKAHLGLLPGNIQ
jgi:hypothetical protein